MNVIWVKVRSHLFFGCNNRTKTWKLGRSWNDFSVIICLRWLGPGNILNVRPEKYFSFRGWFPFTKNSTGVLFDECLSRTPNEEGGKLSETMIETCFGLFFASDGLSKDGRLILVFGLFEFDSLSVTQAHEPARRLPSPTSNAHVEISVGNQIQILEWMWSQNIRIFRGFHCTSTTTTSTFPYHLIIITTTPLSIPSNHS